ncbi:MAG: S-adenosylmethionine:tRNA ribosyltransferase-isomerase [Bacteroidetes bacterium]|nr:S-adenosylmethionine:tRNA ribosyltransferase-isomerase [Bacteroidota bacterium]
MEQQLISIKDFYYDLPVDRIAQYPLAERDQSKLLVYKGGVISQSQYTSIADFLPADSLLFFNNTKVIPARLFFKTDTGKDIEIFCLEPISDNSDVYANMMEQGSSTWKCLVGGAAKWKQQFVFLHHPVIQIKAEIKERLQGTFILTFTWEPSDKTFAEVLQIAGAIPIPPYLKRATEELDLERYQTIYANKEGSVAAPTAGLHFTDAVFETLRTRNIVPTYVTLHVGAGTFKPVKSETMGEHDMHAEYIDVPLSTVEYLYSNLHKPITAVGTTSLRTLESLFWMGEKISREPFLKPQELSITQWQPYESVTVISLEEALLSIITYLKRHQLNTLYAKTSLLIAPGYQFKVVNQLITNFHQPESTLILLVAAFIGKDWRTVYQYALDHDFRFLSYGDGSLLFRTT